MTYKECPFEAWQLIQAREVIHWLTKEKAMSLGKQSFLERIENTLFNIAYTKRMCKHWGAITYFGKPANYTIGNSHPWIFFYSSRQKTVSITDTTLRHNLHVSILNNPITIKL